jgi:poly(3-hydroxybutyrate) depolymerase
LGWLAKESKIDSNWNVMEWKASIDGETINLKAFEWIEIEYTHHGENYFSRFWEITLKDLSPGEHTLIYSWTSKKTIDDGFEKYQPGTYKHTVNFIVQERKDYPPLTNQPISGQHAYSSEDGKFNYLLFLPDGYGEDLQQEWPLIVYLHGAFWRGVLPEMLLDEALPHKLEEEQDFPFVVLAPIGDGGYEFWATDEMIDPLFILLNELQAKLTIDPTRIYLTGNDMGGNGVWTIALKYPDYFAALAPITGYFNYPFEVPENICDLKDVPVWAFHGKRDKEIPLEAEQQLVDALNACGGNAQITISRQMQIDVRYNVYERQDLYDWFLDQSLD